MISKKTIHFVRSLSRAINRSDHKKTLTKTGNLTHFESLPTVENTKNSKFYERIVKYPSSIFKNALFGKVSKTEIWPKKHYQNEWKTKKTTVLVIQWYQAQQCRNNLRTAIFQNCKSGICLLANVSNTKNTWQMASDPLQFSAG